MVVETYVYVVKGSEDGVIAVTSSAKKAIEKLPMYFAHVEPEITPKDALAELNKRGFTTVYKKGSSRIYINIDRFILNR